MNFFKSGVVLATAVLAVTTASMGTSAHARGDTTNRGKYKQKHDSNTLHRLGNAIQYPFRKLGENTSAATHKTANAAQYSTRKMGENASVAAHETTGKNSLERDRTHHGKKIVTAKGRDIHLGPLHHSRYRRRHTVRHHRHHVR